MNNAYINYKKISLRYHPDDFSFDVILDGKGTVIEKARITDVVSDNEPIFLSDYSAPYVLRRYGKKNSCLDVRYSDEKSDRMDLYVFFEISDSGVNVRTFCESGTDVRISGTVCWGNHDQEETVACCIDRDSNSFRNGYGPAASLLDNALFDRDTDSAIVFSTEKGKNKLSFNWDDKHYHFYYSDGDHYFGDEGHFLHIGFENDVYADMFDIEYRKLERNGVFKRPPTGWMTWYAVQWAACEEVILDNTKFQADVLKDYGADTIWVDAEYRHRDGSGYGIEGYNNYIPNEKYYPHGMKYLSDKIRGYGFIPALWICPEVDTQPNEYTEEHPEIVMSRRLSWAGSYWMDPSNPIVIERAMKKIIDLTVNDWGYDAIKWDALPELVWNTDENRDNLFDQSKSTRQILVDYFKKAEEYAGKQCPMLSCCGFGERELEIFMQMFSSARIGGDIFLWSDMVALLFHYIYRDYSFHNIVIDNDPDSVVLREKYNTKNQAITRASMVSLLGLPYAIGDDLTKMTAERLDILKRTIPPLPVHPMDINKKNCDKTQMKICSYVEKPGISYCVVGLLNLSADKKRSGVDFRNDLGLEDGTYYVYDYWNDGFVGEISGGIDLTLDPYETKVFSLHKKTDIPQIVSTSRHVMQGAEDLLSVSYADGILYGRSGMIKDAPYNIVFTVPDGFVPKTDGCVKIAENCYKCKITKPKTGIYDWQIEFQE